MTSKNQSYEQNQEQYRNRKFVSLHIPKALFVKIGEVCDAYEFKKGQLHDMLGLLEFLVTTVANDPKTTERRLKLLHEELVSTQMKIQKIEATGVAVF